MAPCRPPRAGPRVCRTALLRTRPSRSSRAWAWSRGWRRACWKCRKASKAGSMCPAQRATGPGRWEVPGADSTSRRTLTCCLTSRSWAPSPDRACDGEEPPRHRSTERTEHLATSHLSRNFKTEREYFCPTMERYDLVGKNQAMVLFHAIIMQYNNKWSFWIGTTNSAHQVGSYLPGQICNQGLAVLRPETRAPDFEKTLFEGVWEKSD